MNTLVCGFVVYIMNTLNGIHILVVFMVVIPRNFESVRTDVGNGQLKTSAAAVKSVSVATQITINTYP